MKIVMFYHSLLSDWNHGNAHFLRGIATELVQRGHDVQVLESRTAWSRENLINSQGEQPVRDFHRAYPLLHSAMYDEGETDLEPFVECADLVLVHEWNTPWLVGRMGELRRRYKRMRLLFHDTHHRMVSDPGSMAAYDLSRYDGVLAFGEAVRKVYLDRSLARRAWTWHEAADIRVFRPHAPRDHKTGLVWIGNWGDGERTEEIKEFLIGPAVKTRVGGRVYGVRYPQEGRSLLASASLEYCGWTPNFRVPSIFSSHVLTVHIPRRPYTCLLPGIPTIRVFEALACGIPLICSPWQDTEGLFTPGKDFLIAADGREMARCINRVKNDPGLAAELASRGLKTILERHTCAHRVDELLGIAAELGADISVSTYRENKICKA